MALDDDDDDWPETRPFTVLSPGEPGDEYQMYLEDRGWFERSRTSYPLLLVLFSYIIIYYFLPNKLALTPSFFVIIQVILGKVVRFPTPLDKQLQKKLLDCSGDILTAVGDTMCTHDFYEGELKGRHL